MDEMREIVTMEQAERAFLLLAVAVPLVGAVVGALIRARGGHAAAGARAGFLIGLIGPANYLLWKAYNAITDRLGMDTVKNLLVNLGLFIILGVVAGHLISKYSAGRLRRDGDAMAGSGSGLATPLVGSGPGASRMPEESIEPPRDA